MEGKEFLFVSESKDSEANIDVVADIIPKIEINLIDLDIAIQILTMARSNAIAARTNVTVQEVIYEAHIKPQY